MKKKEILHYVINFIFPRHCVVCDEILPFGLGLNNEYLCPNCKDKLVFIDEPYCKKCGAKIYDTDEMYCDNCKIKIKENSTYFEYGFGLFRYNDYLKESLHRVKYKGKKEYLQFYGKCLARAFKDKINDLNPDCFIPVPIHKKRLIQRSYNQATVLAKVISDELKKYNIYIPVNENVIFRKKNTTALNKLGVEERKSQISGAFTVNKYDNIKTIILIDDIYTLGNTINEVSRELKNAGIEKVYFIVITVVDNV